MRGILALLTLLVCACAPTVRPMGPAIAAPRLLDDRIVMADGAELPLRRWLPDRPPQAVIIALHGFNDYSNAFAEPGRAWATAGIVTYAFDQRGFGAAPGRGLWPGVDTQIADIQAATTVIARRHPETPLFVLGESMGAAVLLAAAAQGRLTEADGFILSAPAVGGREIIAPVWRAAAWFVAHTVPWLSSELPPNLGFRPSDNIEMLRALGRDPLVIKETRVDAAWGLAHLMDAALEDVAQFDREALILLGARDNVIPSGAIALMLDRLPEPKGTERRVAIYENGYHMLFRDLQAAVVHRDVAHWALSRRSDRTSPLPSGADRGRTAPRHQSSSQATVVAPPKP